MGLEHDKDPSETGGVEVARRESSGRAQETSAHAQMKRKMSRAACELATVRSKDEGWRETHSSSERPGRRMVSCLKSKGADCR